jgi:hypothetical protein
MIGLDTNTKILNAPSPLTFRVVSCVLRNDHSFAVFDDSKEQVRLELHQSPKRERRELACEVSVI